LAIVRVNRAVRRQREREALEIRLAGLREGLHVEDIAERIGRLDDVLPLLAWRWAHGWSRSELSARIDAAYERDGLAPPSLTDPHILRWEHGQRRPNDERIDYLCRVYQTRPDRLGFGEDHSLPEITHLERAGLLDIYPHTDDESTRDLFARISSARRRVNVFGLTRNFYARDHVLPMIEAKARTVPVRMFMMDPRSDSRRDRYRLEPAEAALENADRYLREVLGPLIEAEVRLADYAPRGAGLQVWLYNFPCSFAIEEIDDEYRVMLYGHGKRGTDGPILIFGQDTPYAEYFASQMRWVERLAQQPWEPWKSKGLEVYRAADVVAR
jgi:transcriptional regulator with XRE-family HTH domain